MEAKTCMKECPECVNIISLTIMNQILSNPCAYRD